VEWSLEGRQGRTDEDGSNAWANRKSWRLGRERAELGE
jgi:hypothetical protein